MKLPSVLHRASVIFLAVSFILASGCAAQTDGTSSRSRSSLSRVRQSSSSSESQSSSETNNSSIASSGAGGGKSSVSSTTQAPAPSPYITVAVSINCATAVKYGKRKNAVIISSDSVGINKGGNVYDALVKACADNHINIKKPLSLTGNVYIKSIDGLSEFDCGGMSGWEYMVNGTFPPIGCNRYICKNGDRINWEYTCDLGKDIGKR